MSKYYATLQGDNRKSVTRAAHRHLEAHLRGWDFGVVVTIYTGPDGKETIRIERTGGSNNPVRREVLTFKEGE